MFVFHSSFPCINLKSALIIFKFWCIRVQIRRGIFLYSLSESKFAIFDLKTFVWLWSIINYNLSIHKKYYATDDVLVRQLTNFKNISKIIENIYQHKLHYKKNVQPYKLWVKKKKCTFFQQIVRLCKKQNWTNTPTSFNC